ncbi:MAG TPA: STAS domain-containing protein [Ferruginibacter sp.]|nr:anti-anti-sigma factor [Chitinophagaceae bacterium]HRI23801.1 STAS domain-containing protein [Ferruginibacter sp.]
MNVKTDTKERFTVITPQEAGLSVNMTEELRNLLLPYLQKDIPHIVLKMEAVTSINEDAIGEIAELQQQFYAANASFVICCLQPDVLKSFEKLDFFDVMNITPSESEAWDIVQMEEIERELLGDE